MELADGLVALIAVLAGFAVGYAFRGWVARRVAGKRSAPGSPS